MNESSNRGWKNINISCEVLTDKLNVPAHWFILFSLVFLFMIFSSFTSAFTFLLIISPSHPPPPTTFFVLLKMFINVSWSSQSNWKGERGWVWKGRTRQGETSIRKKRKVWAQTEKKKQRRMKTKVNWCVRKKKTRKGKTHVFSTLKLRKMVYVFLKEIYLNLLRYIQFIFLMKSQKYKIETHRSLSF